jgi:hypothetical protein
MSERSLRAGDRVRGNDGRLGIIEDLFADQVAWVRWEKGPPGYVNMGDLTKTVPVTPARQKAARRESKTQEEPDERSGRYRRSAWPRAGASQLLTPA